MILFLAPIILTFSLFLLTINVKIKYNKIYFIILLYFLAFFAGFRHETGQDWEAYEEYFKKINISLNIIDSYSETISIGSNLQFEFGYFLLNYIIKFFGFTYHIVFLFASIFCTFSLYYLLSVIPVNKFFVLLVYLSYSYLLLHFAQTRQSIAIGFFLLGFAKYIKSNNLILSIIFCSISILFQVTSVLFIFMFCIIIFAKKRNINIVSILSLTLFICYIFIKLIPLEYILPILPIGLVVKLFIYQENQTIQGSGQLIFAFFLFLTTFFIFFYSKEPSNSRYYLVHSYAILSLILTIFVSLVVPNNYAIFSRLYEISSIFQACSVALIYNNNKKNIIIKSFFFITSIISLIYFTRLFLINGHEYLPYKSIFHEL